MHNSSEQSQWLSYAPLYKCLWRDGVRIPRDRLGYFKPYLMAVLHDQEEALRLALQRCTTHLKRNMLARVRSDEKEELAADLRHVFMTGVENYTIDDAWQRWQKLCNKWGQYTAIKRMGEDESYRYYLTYLTYHKDIQSMIYTTNWIERLQRTFRRVLRFRTALPNEQSALTLMGKTVMDIRCYQRKIPNINLDHSLFGNGTCPTTKQTNQHIDLSD